MKPHPSGWWTCLLVAAGTLLAPAARAGDAPLAARARAILQSHCHRCHGQNGTAKGGFSYVLDRDKLLARDKLVPGQPAASELYQRVRDGEMPPADQKTRPNRAELAVLEQWIAAGAPAGRDPPQPRASLSTTDLHRLLLADLETLNPRHRRFARYLSLAHQAHAGLDEPEIQTGRLALAKLLNSLSWHPRLTLPEGLDPGRTVFRIDLRDLKWNARSWEHLRAVYPYRLPSGSHEARALAAATATELPLIRADWFVAAASRPPLYHDLLQLPGSDRSLERLLQVDVPANIAEDRVARAGFVGSGVSRNNRLIERHDAAYGAYWRSYDFSDNRDRQNLFKHPLGPAPHGPDSFVHAGGEVLFSLPNGLQAYLLVDAGGRRVDQAPVEIVSDPQRPDRKVETGLSCMSCHVRGIIPKADQVRAHVRKNPQAFTPADVAAVKALYPPDARMQALMKEDSERFLRALAKLGIKPEYAEPITIVARRYEGPLDLAAAAAEVGVAPAELAARLERSAGLARRLGPLRVKGGTVQRETFQAEFGNLVREIHPLPADGPPPAPAVGVMPFAGHTGPVTCLAFSPDGRQALSGSDDQTVRLWDVAGGRELRRFDGHTAAVAAVAFTPDGRQAVSGGSDRTVRLWEVTTGKELRRFPGHLDAVRCVACSPDGQLLLSGDQDGALRLGEVRTGSVVRSFGGHAGPVASVQFAPDGRRALSGGYDRNVRLWDVATGKEVQRFEGHTREVYAVAFSPDGRQVLSGGNDKAVRLWDVATGQELRRFEGHANAVIRVAFTPDGRILSASSQYQSADHTLRIWDRETGRELARYGGKAADRVGCVAFAPDGRSALTGSPEPTLRFWQLTK